MTSFKCCYSGRVNNENSIRTEMLEANDARQAYEKFLANQGQFPEAVYVSCEYGERLFEDHIPEARAKAFLEKIADGKREIEHRIATKKAEASLSSTDILLKQLTAKQDKTNQWLRKITWSIWCIFLILVFWNLLSWRYYQIR